MTPNPAHALDAAMSLSFHLGQRWRGASDVRRWPLPMKQCLSCRSDRVVSGKISAGRDPAVFQPDGLRSFTFTLLGGTKFTEQAFACLDCGLVWSSISAGELRMFVEKHCG